MNSKEKYKYWEDIAQYDLETAKAMFDSRRYLYVIFMCQQSIEKLVKGLFVLYTNQEPLRTHNIWNILCSVLKHDLIKINNPSLINKKNKYKPFFALLHAYYISERYPTYREKLSVAINQETALEVLTTTKEVFLWLKSLKKFSK